MLFFATLNFIGKMSPRWRREHKRRVRKNSIFLRWHIPVILFQVHSLSQIQFTQMFIRVPKWHFQNEMNNVLTSRPTTQNRLMLKIHVNKNSERNSVEKFYFFFLHFRLFFSAFIARDLHASNSSLTFVQSLHFSNFRHLWLCPAPKHSFCLFVRLPFFFFDFSLVFVLSYVFFFIISSSFGWFVVLPVRQKLTGKNANQTHTTQKSIFKRCYLWAFFLFLSSSLSSFAFSMLWPIAKASWHQFEEHEKVRCEQKKKKKTWGKTWAEFSVIVRPHWIWHTFRLSCVLVVGVALLFCFSMSAKDQRNDLLECLFRRRRQPRSKRGTTRDTRTKKT